ncbi:endoribonuclease Dicer homolog 2-like [Carya illinoinensis]|uniref:PAZ domain-containing protein n=1 Tax=Carya illinoinensis TaxID=32201 RepID=A0A922JAI5_CARIL|nr:endoribonuclease Dicer homolog 2-like [Carya illinoinensis]XP_042990760.1 endoribonuclease Dicer homolog 2-like [Carya illinoinensis]KAG6700460.1 hypothetical protein I3842_08G113300 [Carya illinoinensis]KAG6700461.1 hypothetical protein I3842_08G113300 [Carya illinoinensis]KAG6700462.1 hypothetical protein I3842_08G113300 [Carya illinoinensis]
MEKIVEETACLEVCNQIHEIDALRDNLVEEADAQERGNEPYIDEQPSYFPVPEPVGHLPKNSNILHHYYLIELEQIFVYDIPVRDIVLVLRNKLEAELGSLHFDLHVDRGRLTVNLKYVGEINLTTDQVLLCRRFQKTLLRVLIDHDLKSLNEHMDGDILEIETEYLLLPATAKHQRPVIIDWPCVNSVLFSCKKNGESPLNCSLAEGRARIVQTKDGPVCTSLLQNSLVYTPHTDQMYCTTGILELNANSRMKHHRRGKINTYKKYFEERHGIMLCFEQQSLVRGRPIFREKNHLQRRRNQKEKESSMPSVELPPELCSIVMSPISINTFYSFSFVPSIMHPLESLLLKSLKESKAFSSLSASHSELSSSFELSRTVQMVTATTSTGFEAVAKRKPLFIKVEQLKPDTQGHTLGVKVLSPNTVKVTDMILSRPLQYPKPAVKVINMFLSRKSKYPKAVKVSNMY